MIKVISCIIVMVVFSAAIVSYGSPEGSEMHAYSDTVPAGRKAVTDELLRDLRAQLNESADAVFKNLKLYNTSHRISVKQLIDTMEYWSRSLDINCDYCHQKNDWASEALSAKQIARDMYAMQNTINKELLTKIKHLASEPAVINCNTCHHGSVLPLD